MATELGILTCLMIFAASTWIPYVIGITSDPSKEDAFERPDTRREVDISLGHDRAAANGPDGDQASISKQPSVTRHDAMFPA